MPTEREKAYTAFLRSKTWKEFRQKIIKKRGGRCEACNLKLSSRMSQVHHKTYERFGGRELQKDVALLCRHCHRLTHKIHKQNGCKDLAKVTDLVIAYVKRMVLLQALDK